MQTDILYIEADPGLTADPQTRRVASDHEAHDPGFTGR